MQQAGAIAFYDYEKGIENANLLKISLTIFSKF